MANRMRGEVIVDGLRLPIDKAVVSQNLQRELSKGNWESKEAEAGRGLVGDGNVVLELGACLGFISSYLRKHTNAGPIVAFEANPRLIPYIEEVHRLNGISNITVVNAIVQPSPTTTSVKFYCREDVPESSLSPDPGPVSAVVEVATRPWADVLAQYKPNVLIADIEGAELELFTAESLDPVERLSLELHPQLYGAGGLLRILSDLQRLGFVSIPGASTWPVASFRRS